MNCNVIFEVIRRESKSRCRGGRGWRLHMLSPTPSPRHLATGLLTLFPSVREISPGKGAVFPSIYLPHLHRKLPDSLGLQFVKQPYPAYNALCGFCSSDRKFAAGFLQIPRRRGHPCPWLCAWHYQPALGTFTL